MAVYLSDLDLVSWNDYDATPYTDDDEWPTVIGPDGPPTPDQLVVITATTTAPRIRARVMQGVQIRLRGPGSTQDSEPDPEIVAAKGQAIADALYPNGFPLVHVLLGDVRVGAVLSGSTMLLEPDTRGRHGLIMNFTVRAQRPHGEE
jgi:hypothetical protein